MKIQRNKRTPKKRNKTILLSVHVLTKLTQDEINDFDEKHLLDALMDNMKNAIVQVKAPTKLKWTSSSMRVLEPKSLNCGRCSKCNAWTSDYEKPEPIQGLKIGARVHGKLLCDECLPRGHRLAF